LGFEVILKKRQVRSKDCVGEKKKRSFLFKKSERESWIMNARERER